MISKIILVIILFINANFAIENINDIKKEIDILMKDYNISVTDSIELKGHYLNLIKISSDEAITIIVKSDNYAVEKYLEDKLIVIFDEAIKELALSGRRDLYSKIIKYDINNIKEWQSRSFIWRLLSKVDRFQCYNDLEKMLVEEQNNDLYMNNYHIISHLAKLRYKGIAGTLEKYKSKNVYERIVISSALCLINYKYEENFNFLKELITNPDKNVLYDYIHGEVYDILLEWLFVIGDPKILNLIKKMKIYGYLGMHSLQYLESNVNELKIIESYIHRSKIKIKSSSELESKNNPFAYVKENILDNDLNTAWFEGTNGDGINEFIQIDFCEKNTINKIFIANGYNKSSNLFRLNNRIKLLEISMPKHHTYVIEIKDKIGWQALNIPILTTQSIKLTIKEIYKGDEYSDTGISDIKFLIKK